MLGFAKKKVKENTRSLVKKFELFNLLNIIPKAENLLEKLKILKKIINKKKVENKVIKNKILKINKCRSSNWGIFG